MRDVSKYFDIINSTIRHSSAIDYETTYEEHRRTMGVITATLWFADTSRLELKEVVLIQNQRATKLSYSYQYMREDELVVRYDNAEHHRRVKTFPHHKHIGRKVVAASEPTLKQVLEEIAALME